MRRLWKISALVLALAMMPGTFEVTENTAHLVTEGHLAHATPDGDHHGPADSEHGCTPTLHVCGCHASLALLEPTAPPSEEFRAADLNQRRASDRRLNGFLPTLDRPPQA